MKKETIKELVSYIIIFVVVMLIKTFIVTPVRVNGDSMYPTLKDKEIMILNKTKYWNNDIERFDIVVLNEEGSKLIKRVIGLPNEKVEYKDGYLYINDRLIAEEFINVETSDYIYDEPKDCYIVIGDNRNNSYDSRDFGCVKEENIVGNARQVIFPFNKIRTVK